MLLTMHYVSLSLALSVCLSVFLSVCLSVCLSAHLSIALSISGYWLLSPHTRSSILTKQPKTTHAVRSSAFACVCIRVSVCTIIFMHICACSCVSVSAYVYVNARLCSYLTVVYFAGRFMCACMHACVYGHEHIYSFHTCLRLMTQMYTDAHFRESFLSSHKRVKLNRSKNKPPSSVSSTCRAPIWHSAAL